jgi:hypothetical protein
MAVGNPRNIISGAATVFVDSTGKSDFDAGSDIGATTTDGVSLSTDPEIPGFEVDQVNVVVLHALDKLKPMVKFSMAEVTLANLLRFIPGANDDGGGVISGGQPGGDVLQKLSCYFTGDAPGGGVARFFIPRAVPMGSPAKNYQRNELRVVPVELAALLPHPDDSSVVTDAAAWTFPTGTGVTAGTNPNGDRLTAVTTASSATALLNPNPNVISGVEYIVDFDIDTFSAGSVRFSIGGTLTTLRTATGSYSETVIAGGSPAGEVKAIFADGTTMVVNQIRAYPKNALNILYS